MKTVWKFEIPIQDEASIVAPEECRVLTVGEQNGKLMMWAVVDIDSPKRVHRVIVAGTGHRLPNDVNQYCGTVQMKDGLVWHVFLPADRRVIGRPPQPIS